MRQPDEMAPWFVLVTDPQREARTAATLISGGNDAYCPQEPKRVRQNRSSWRTVMRPMLIGYIFTVWDGTPRAWARIHGVLGVRKLLRMNDKPSKVPDAAIMQMKQKEAQSFAEFGKRKSRTSVKIGDFVQVLEPFSLAGLVGQVVEIIDAKDRIKIDIDSGRRLTRFELSANQVRGL